MKSSSRPALPLEALLAPLASLYAGIMRVRNVGYTRGWLPSYEVGVPVLSIGNLTAGGTGKTPLTELFVGALLARGVRVGIISRGYRGTGTGAERVRPEAGAEGARRFGDEPTWLAGRFPTVPVYVGTDKVAVCQKLLSENSVDLIVADDAFQHRRLRRAFDVVVMDASEPAWHYRQLPLGRLREGFASLGRAHAVFLTKVNLAEPSHLAWLREQAGRVGPADRSGQSALGFKLHVFEMSYRIQSFHQLATGSTRSISGERVLLVSGIARPATFPLLVKDAAPEAEIVEHLVFADHHPYTADDFAKIEAKALALKANRIIVTEKDAVKMADWRPGVDVLVSRLEARSEQDLEEFYEVIRRLAL
jgi:tetraacyldisaccharide 4'-kinase